ncbi:MAG: NAD(P)-dependent oxidoreductase [Elusimicrobia bacterium]|nr:NAD(P)-dependent oxidoreductase [Elusimicrobiota bacterium]
MLVTGAASGLGRFLHGALGGKGLRRGDPLDGLSPEVIVHCAANARRDAGPEALRADNIAYTERLLALPHGRFVFLSSVEAAAPRSDYARAKAEAEGLVLTRGRRALVARCGALLGPGMRPNALVRLLWSKPVGLASGSVFDWVLYEDVLDFLRAGLEKGLEGIYNLVPSRPATLGEAAAALGLSAEWGAFRYESPRADGSAAAAVCPGLRRTSLENALIHAKGRSN